MKCVSAVLSLLFIAGVLHATVNLSGTVAVDVNGVSSASVGVLVVDTQSNGFSALADVLSRSSASVLETRDDYDFSTTGYQPIGTYAANVFAGRVALSGGTVFDIAPSGGSAVLPGHSFALVVFTNPGVAEGEVKVFFSDDWVIPGDGSTLIFGSDIFQVTADVAADVTVVPGDTDGGGEPNPDAWYNGASDIGGDWRWLPWLRSFNISQEPWIFHPQHGWLFPFGDDPAAGIFFWDVRQASFLYTTGTLYPTMFRFSDNKWIRYQIGSSNPRWFVDLQTAVWEQVD